MPVSRGLPLIVVYALYYAILLYVLSSVGYSIYIYMCMYIICIQICMFICIRVSLWVYIHITICICENALIMYKACTSFKYKFAFKYKCHRFWRQKRGELYFYRVCIHRCIELIMIFLNDLMINLRFIFFFFFFLILAQRCNDV